jgi:hypothetical protein
VITIRRLTPRANVLYGLLGSTLSTLLVSWPVIIGNKLFGDLLDARFTIVINDHWYQILSGQRTLANVGFYFPTTNQLGYSDAFFATGILAIPPRLLGATSVEAWVVSNIALMAICFYFSTILISKLLNSNLIGVLVTVLFSTSYPFTAQMGHLQTVGYLLIFPILFYARHALVESTNLSRSIWIVIMIVQILALTSWYAFIFLLSITLILLGVYTLFVSRNAIFITGNRILTLTLLELKSVTKVKKILSFSSLVVLPVLWMRIYSVGFNQVTNKDYMEFVFYAPRWGDLFNSVNQSWGFQAKFNEVMGQNVSQTFERALGITPILFILLSFVIFRLVRFDSTLESKVKRTALSLLVTATLPALIVVTDEAGHSFWKFIWEVVTPLRSIRVPFRVAIYTTWILLFVIFYVMAKAGVKKRVLSFVFFLLIIDTWRPTPASWSVEDLISKNGQVIEKTLIRENCDSFFVNPSKSNQAKWLTQVEAMLIANSLGNNTVNGYSGNWPNNWPIEKYWGRAKPADIGEWAKTSFGKNTKVCFIDEDKPNTIFVP